MRREHKGVLQRPEAKCVRYLVRKIPDSVSPDQLSALSLFGALVAGVSLVASQFSQLFLIPFFLGMICNWFGDSLDGALARHRRSERHRIGFLIDRCGDTLSFVIVIFGLGLSPYLTPTAALMLLVAYLMHTIYGLMRTIVDGVQIVGYGGVGATEGRLFIVGWVAVSSILRIDFPGLRYNGLPAFEIICGVLLLGTLGLFVMRIVRDVGRIEGLERVEASQKRFAGAGNVVSISRDKDKMRLDRHLDGFGGKGDPRSDLATTIH